jgi:hypothetical protein
VNGYRRKGQPLLRWGAEANLRAKWAVGVSEFHPHLGVHAFGLERQGDGDLIYAADQAGEGGIFVHSFRLALFFHCSVDRARDHILLRVVFVFAAFRAEVLHAVRSFRGLLVSCCVSSRRSNCFMAFEKRAGSRRAR